MKSNCVLPGSITTCGDDDQRIFFVLSMYHNRGQIDQQYCKYLMTSNRFSIRKTWYSYDNIETESLLEE